MKAEHEAGEPMTALQEAVSQLHELYTEFVEGGFTEDQALTLCAKIIAESKRSDED